MTNSIVAGNSAPAAANISGTSVGLNNLTSGNPLLAPLGSYSGPTQTMPPLFGSPAIDAGSDAATNSLVTDQRGLPRLSGMHVDLGAVEFQAGPLVLTNSDSGENSLRAAAAYSSPGTTITFASNLSGGVINLTSGEIALNHDLTIDGSALANPVQINGNSNSAVFVVNSDVTATLTSLTVTNGYNDGYGGGLLTAGTLTLDRCSILGNYATYGGGIFQSAGILVVSNCLVANNRSADCGGIYTYIGATQFLWNSTVTGNSAADTGGGVKTYFGNIIIGNATIVGNAAVNYGGGINNYGGSLALSNSIVAANNAPVSTNLSGSFTGAYNLTNGNPLLAPLGYYGGPTQTMPPLAGSPAIDAGSDVVTSFLAADQRGLPRLSGTHVDIGAVEFQQGLVVTTTADSEEHSLRAAVAYSPSGSTVTFNPGLAGQTILLTSGQLELGKNLTIDGSALPGGITINGNHAGRIFQVDGGVTVVLNSLTITNGTDTGGGNAGGGGILSYGSLTLDNCTLAGNSANQASWGGGGILSYQGTLTVNQSTLSGNSANNFTGGGGIVAYGGTLTVNQSTLSGNSANGGGGILNGEGMTMNNSIVAGNSPDNIVGSFAGANNLTGGNPLLAPLGNYGGPTQTMPPQPGSPAIDAGGPSTFTTDQRGLPRLSGQHVDIGAVEVQIASSAPALTGASWLNLGTPPIPTFQFGFSSLSYGSFTVFATTNAGSPFNTWSNLGPAIETPLGSGQFQFNDPQAANSPQRYYRVRSP